MNSIALKLHLLVYQLEPGNPLRRAEALFFPDISRLGEPRATARTPDAAYPRESRFRDDEAAAHLMAVSVRATLPTLPNLNLAERHLPSELTQRTVQLEVNPPNRNAAWRDPVLLEIPAVQWWQSPECLVVAIPSLGIEVLANREQDLPQLLTDQLRLVLQRRRIDTSLRMLLQANRVTALTVETVVIEHTPLSPKQWGVKEKGNDTTDAELLGRVTSPVPERPEGHAWCRDAELNRVAEVLRGEAPHSVLLVGPSGVGKTAIVREISARRESLGLSGWQFRVTSGSRLISGTTGYGMWQEQLETLRKIMVRERIILHVGSLFELLQLGRYDGQPQGMASFLRPAISRGEVLLIAEATPEQLALIEREDVALARAFVTLEIGEPDDTADRLGILARAAQVPPRESADLFSMAAIAEIERLHRRFATYSAFPVRPLRFLGNLRRDWVAEREEVGQVDLPLPPIEAVDVALAFTRETGLPGWMLDDRIPLDLDAAREWVAARVIGQPEAVDLVVNLLAVLKAQLNRGDRPLANLLFIGPTGVGKTEMAKTLAEFLFGAGAGNDPRLIRVDMSEYADAGSAERLIGGSEKSEGILTARVREQPFSVVLLDELEKAHESLFDLLLQVLGEGRLTDAGGRLADFRNAVVIMTSNLGGATYARRGVGFGLTRAETDRARDHFERSVRDALRPELFNRLDRIVPFLPLDLETARRVVARQLALIRGRDGLKYRQVVLTVGEEVVDHLVERGFEPRHGARSLKRVMERDLLAPLAERLNESSQRVAQRADCTVWKGPPGKELAPEEWRIGHTVRAQTDEQGRPLESAQGNVSQFTDLLELRELQARVTRLRGSSATVDLENSLFRLQQLKHRLERLERPFQELWPVQREMAPLEEWWQGYQTLTQRVYAREEEELVAYYKSDTPPRDNPELQAFNTEANRELTRQLMQLLDRQTETPHSAGLLLVATSAEAMWWLAEAYSDVAEDLSPPGRGGDESPPRARVTLWACLPAGLKRTEIADIPWDLEHLKWQLAEEPEASREEETWRLVTRPKMMERKSASENDQERARQDELEQELERAGAFSPKTVLLRRRFSQWPERARGIPGGTLAVYCEIHGQGAWQRFAGEDGVHRFLTEEGMFEVHVFAQQPPVEKLVPPQTILWLGETKLTTVCRVYDQRTSQVTDSASSETVAWRSKRLTPVVADLLFRRHARLAEALIE